MAVTNFVDMVSKMECNDGSPIKIKGWKKEGAIYQLHAELEEPLVLEFEFNGATAQLQPVNINRRTADPMEFMQFVEQNLATKKMRASQKQVNSITTELEGLDAKRQEQLALVNKDQDKGLAFLRTWIEEMRSGEKESKAKQDKLRTTLPPVLCARVEAEYPFVEKFVALELAEKSFDRFRATSQITAIKLINDAIIAKNLGIDLLPRNGVLNTDRIKRNDRGGGTPYQWIKHSGTVFANTAVEKIKKDREGDFHYDLDCYAWDTVSVIVVDGEARYFYNFPKLIDDESIKKTFVVLYQAYDERVRREAGETAPGETPTQIEFKGNKEEIRSQSRSALEKFDYKNEPNVAEYRQLLSKYDEEMKTLLWTMVEPYKARVNIVEAEAILSMPKEQQGEALRNKIEEVFDMKKDSLKRQLVELRGW